MPKISSMLIVFVLSFISCVTSKKELLYYKVKVKAGDNLKSLSYRFDTNPEQIKRDNKITSNRDLKIGRFIIIRPGPGRLNQDRSRTQLARRKSEKNGKDSFWRRLFFSKDRKSKRKGLLYGGSGGAQLHWPVGGVITSHYGMRGGRLHAGLDIGRNYGAAVRASASGVVTYSGWIRGYGRIVEIDHGRLKTRYAHLKSFSVKKGASVVQGQVIGRVGSSGNTTGAHLHFEVLKDGRAYNPLPFLDQRRIAYNR